MNNREIFQRLIAQTSEAPVGLEVVKAEGLYLYDNKGNKYADLISGIGVSIVGHRHPKVIESIKNQADRYLHTMVYGEHIQAPQTQLAAFLRGILPPSLDNIYFVNSGTEAVEGALKLARRYTGRTEIISAKSAYHGSTAGSASLMSSTFFTGKYRPLVPGIKFIEYNDSSECDKITSKTAAIILECVQGEAGIISGSCAFFKAIRNKCNETGTLLILDEIQSGLGRTGHWWAFEGLGIEPDILLTGKGFGGGLPLAAFISSKKIMHSFAAKPVLGHITTFGGNALCCASSLATLQVIQEEELIAQVVQKTDAIQLIARHTKVSDVRIAGLWAAIELADSEAIMMVIQRLKEKGVLTDWFLFNDKSLRIAPPLNITMVELNTCMEMLLQILNSL